MILLELLDPDVPLRKIYFDSFWVFPTKRCTTLTRSVPSAAGMKPVTAKPGRSQAAVINKRTLITRMNRPRVIRVIGSVRSMRIGLTKLLRTPSTTAANTAVCQVSIVSPGTISLAMRSANALVATYTIILVI